MGTASLVFRLIAIGVGLFFFLGFTESYDTSIGLQAWVLANLAITIPFFVVGGLFLRKFDKDRKKDQNRTN